MNNRGKRQAGAFECALQRRQIDVADSIGDGRKRGRSIDRDLRCGHRRPQPQRDEQRDRRSPERGHLSSLLINARLRGSTRLDSALIAAHAPVRDRNGDVHFDGLAVQQRRRIFPLSYRLERRVDELGCRRRRRFLRY